MRKLRMLVLIGTIFAVSIQTVQADCEADIRVCDKAYQAQKQANAGCQALSKALKDENILLEEDLAKEKEKAGKFYNNGLAMAGIGGVTGVAAVLVSPVVIPAVGLVVLLGVLGSR